MGMEEDAPPVSSMVTRWEEAPPGYIGMPRARGTGGGAWHQQYGEIMIRLLMSRFLDA